MQSKPVHYLQWDNRWGGIMFSNHGDRSQTIASSGCGATSMAMVAAAFIDPAIDPPTLAGFIVANGYRTYNNGVDWGFFPFAADYYKLPFKQTSITDEVIQALQDGALVVASMGPGYFTRFGHYILLWGLDGSGNILTNDPNSETRTQASYDLFRRESANYFIFWPKPKEQPQKVVEHPALLINVRGTVLEGTIIGDTGFAPIRKIAEALGVPPGNITWDEATRTVHIN